MLLSTKLSMQKELITLLELSSCTTSSLPSSLTLNLWPVVLQTYVMNDYDDNREYGDKDLQIPLEVEEPTSDIQ